MTDEALVQRIEELEREVEKLKKEINKLKAADEWAESELENHNDRIKIIEKILDVYYDKDKQRWKSKFLSRIYATLMKHEKKLSPKQQ